MKIGDRVEILKQVEIKSEGGKLRAKYTPGFIYAVTEGNLTTFAKAIADGSAREYGGPPPPAPAPAEAAPAAAVKLPASPSRVRGRFSTTKKG